jgi:hypothetical protein
VNALDLIDVLPPGLYETILAARKTKAGGRLWRRA